MSGSDFRQITLNGEAPKRERLFQAAVSAFCSLTRPSRREISQLEELTLPLFDCVSPESRRYVAAALSECLYPPPRLVRRLCDEPLEIAAPLLVRSKALTEIDLLALIGRHGAGHARAIGRRPGLNPTIAELIGVIDRKSRRQNPEAAETKADRRGGLPNEPKLQEQLPQGAENARRRLRSMMIASESRKTPSGPVPSRYLRLRDTALAGQPALFHTALADALEDRLRSHPPGRPHLVPWLAPHGAAGARPERRAGFFHRRDSRSIGVFRRRIRPALPVPLSPAVP